MKFSNAFLACTIISLASTTCWSADADHTTELNNDANTISTDLTAATARVSKASAALILLKTAADSADLKAKTDSANADLYEKAAKTLLAAKSAADKRVDHLSDNVLGFFPLVTAWIGADNTIHADEKILQIAQDQLTAANNLQPPISVGDKQVQIDAATAEVKSARDALAADTNVKVIAAKALNDALDARSGTEKTKATEYQTAAVSAAQIAASAQAASDTAMKYHDIAIASSAAAKSAHAQLDAGTDELKSATKANDDLKMIAATTSVALDRAKIISVPPNPSQDENNYNDAQKAMAAFTAANASSTSNKGADAVVAVGQVGIDQSKGATLVTSNILSAYINLYDTTNFGKNWGIGLTVTSSLPGKTQDAVQYAKTELLGINSGVANIYLDLFQLIPGNRDRAWGNRGYSVNRIYLESLRSGSDVLADSQALVYFSYGIGAKAINLSDIPDQNNLTGTGTGFISFGIDGAVHDITNNPKSGGFDIQIIASENVGNKAILRSVLGDPKFPAHYETVGGKVYLYYDGLLALNLSYDSGIRHAHQTLGETYSLGFSYTR